jgi:ribose 5-phosphate isomerase B
MMKTGVISLGTDHAGYHYKERVRAHLEGRGFRVLDFGTNSDASCDYPDFVNPAACAVASGEAQGGVVFGGSGNGEAIVANKVKGIRCGVCWNVESARLTKSHNNANVISIGARMVAESELTKIVDTWLDTAFDGGRHATRVAKVHALEDDSVS